MLCFSCFASAGGASVNCWSFIISWCDDRKYLLWIWVVISVWFIWFELFWMVWQLRQDPSLQQPWAGWLDDVKFKQVLNKMLCFLHSWLFCLFAGPVFQFLFVLCLFIPFSGTLIWSCLKICCVAFVHYFIIQPDAASVYFTSYNLAFLYSACLPRAWSAHIPCSY